MSDTTYKLWCVEGQRDPFKVVVSRDEDIGDLKEKIAQKVNKGSSPDVNPIDLALWKVRYFY
jgi:hypothetical protein